MRMEDIGVLVYAKTSQSTATFELSGARHDGHGVPQTEYLELLCSSEGLHHIWLNGRGILYT